MTPVRVIIRAHRFRRSAPLRQQHVRIASTGSGPGRLISTLLVVAVLTMFAGGTATAQHHAKRGLQVGLKLGLSSYNGDIDVRRKNEAEYAATYEGELFYRLNRRFGIGLKQSIGNYPELSQQGSRRNSTAIAVRSYLLKTRVAPYVQIGASRSSGGTEAGYGIAFATGFELEISPHFALYQDISFDQVLPDKALDGLTGGRKFDLFGRVGVGIRFNLGRSRNSLFLSDVQIPDSITVGEQNQFRAVVDGHDESDLSFTWSLPEGPVYRLNPLYHSFSSPGTYKIRLTVASSDELIKETFVVTVRNPAAPPETLSSPVVTAAAVSPVASETSMAHEPLPDEDDSTVAAVSTNGDPVVRADSLSVDESSIPRETITIAADPLATAVLDNGTPALRSDSLSRTETTAKEKLGATANVPERPVLSRDIEALADTRREDADPRLVETTTRRKDTVPPEVNTTEPKADSIDVSVASSVAVPIARDNNEGSQVAPELPQPPSTFGTVGFEPRRTQFKSGDFAWVVETVGSEAEAIQRTDRYKFLSLPFGYAREPSTGRYHVLVGQFVSERIADKVSSRIQSHAPRVIWLYKVK